MGSRRAVLAIAAWAIGGCVPDRSGAFDLDAHRTLIIGLLGTDPDGRPRWTPQLHDLRRDETRIVYPEGEDERPPLALWAATVEELRIELPVRATTATTCVSNRLALASADRVVCDPFEGASGADCPADARFVSEGWAVVTERWSDPDPCTSWEPFDRYTVTNFDIQQARPDPGRADVTAGNATLLVPLGGGKMVVGQMAGWSHGQPYDANTIVGTLDTAQLDAEPTVDPLPVTATVTRAAWVAGARASSSSAWLGGLAGSLALFHSADARVETVIAPSRAGTVTDLVVDPAEPERVYAVTSSCAVVLRAPGAGAWTQVVPPIAHLVRPSDCQARIQMVGPRHALVVGIPAALPGEPPPTARTAITLLDRIIEIRDATPTVMDPVWPPLGDQVGRSLRGIAVYDDRRIGVRMAVAGGAQYSRIPTLDRAPYDAGAGRAVFFVREAERSDAPWVAVPLSLGPGRAPLLVGDLQSTQVAGGAPIIDGVLVGAYVELYLFDPLRALRGAADPITLLDQRWNPMSYFPLVNRVRPDDEGGFLVGTGDLFIDGRIDFQDRFHWWRPIRP